MQTLRQQFSIQYTFPVYFNRNVFRQEDPLLASVFLRGGREHHNTLCVIDSGVISERPALAGKIESYAEAHRGPDALQPMSNYD